MANEFIARNGVISRGNVIVTGSLTTSGSLTTTGTITATTLVVQTITSSVNFVTGSTKFGAISSNTHQFTGSVNITGSLSVVTTGTEFQVNATGVNLGNVLTDSHVISGSLRVNPNGLFVSSSGNVGIGTTTTSGRLDVQAPGTSAFSYYFRNSNGGYAGGVYNTGANHAQLYLATSAGTENVLVAATGSSFFNGGNVGIGTSSPSQRFHVANSSGGVVAYLQSTATNGEASVALEGRNSSGTTRNAIFKYDNADVFRLGTSSNIGLRFETSDTERMRITSGGDVGIGGTAGSGRLQVWGQDQSSSNFGLNVYNSGGFGMFFVRNDGNMRFNSGVYGNTTSGTTRTLYIGVNDYYIGGISSVRASKKNIENINNVNWLYQLNPVTFNYRKKDREGNYTEETYEDLNYGLIAEDTAPIADFLINYNDKEDGSKEMIGIEYPRLITPMLKAIQEQQALITDLRTEIEELKARI
jgi:hypothetical protein